MDHALDERVLEHARPGNQRGGIGVQLIVKTGRAVIGAALVVAAVGVGCGSDDDARSNDHLLTERMDPTSSDPGNDAGASLSDPTPTESADVTAGSSTASDPTLQARPGASDLAPSEAQPALLGPPTAPTSVVGPLDETSAPVVDAIADLAHHLAVDTDAITVERADAVVWADGSLGCPRSGMVYPQVLTDGVLIVLEVEGTAHQYHGGSPPFRCG